MTDKVIQFDWAHHCYVRIPTFISTTFIPTAGGYKCGGYIGRFSLQTTFTPTNIKLVSPHYPR